MNRLFPAKSLYFITSLCLALPLATLAAGTDDNLIARWTFNDNAFKSDRNDLDFNEDGKGSVEINDDAAIVRGRRHLVCPDLNDQKFPELKKTATLWARVKFDELPSDFVTNFLSLQSVAGAGSWKEMALSFIYRGPDPDLQNIGLAALARLTEGEIGIGASRMIPVTPGEFFNVALVFDGDAGKITMWVNGEAVHSQDAGGKELTEILALGLGQLQVPGPDISITYDEVRVYDTVLDENSIAEIKPVAD